MHLHIVYSLFLLLLFSVHSSTAQDLDKLSYAEINNLVMEPYSKGDFKTCIAYMQAGREKAKAEFGTKDSVYAEYTSNLGFFYDQLGQYAVAEKLMLESKELIASLSGKEHPTYAGILNNLAQLYFKMGTIANAEPMYLESKAIYEKVLGKEDSLYATSLTNLAYLYIRMGKYTEAEQLYLEAIAIEGKILGKTHRNYAISLNSLAGLYHTMGLYDQAEPLLLQAKNIKEQIFGKMHPAYASTINNLANLRKEMGKYSEAEPLYLEALNIIAKILGKEHPDYANTLNNFAGLYVQMRIYAKAEPLYLEAKSIWEKVLGKQHPNYGLSLNNIASLYIEMNKQTLAWKALQEAMSSFLGVNISMIISESWADSILNTKTLSDLYVDKIINALQLADFLITIDESISNKKEQQIILANLAHQLLKKSRDDFVHEKDKLRILAQSNNWMLRSLEVLDLEKQADKAFEIVELNKAGLLLESAKSEQAYQLGDLPDSLIQEEKKLLKKYAQVEAKLVEKRSDEEKEKLRSVMNGLTEDIRLFKDKLKTNYPKYAAFKYQQHETNISEIQQSLDTQTALLEYVIGKDAIYVFYIDKQSVKIHTYKIDTEELRKRIKEFHHNLSNYKLLLKEETKSYEDYTKNAHWFYQNLVAPAIQNTTTAKPSSKININQLIIITDGELGHLPFESFLVEPAPQKSNGYKNLHYLIQDYKISYNYSASLFRENSKDKNAKKSNKILALAANYDLKLPSQQTALRLPSYLEMRENLQPLPEAKKEIEVLASAFEGFFDTDILASEKTFKEKASDYSIIHLAMHGLLDEKSPILSGLVFSEDGDSLENNFLQAYEISKMNIYADLVVLSACETGFGKFEKGNGIASLARAFMYAGASSMIVSLWQVSDYATARVMNNLYQNLAKGMDKAAALQQAKLEYIQTTEGVAAHPAFWSPFILMGNTDGIYLKTKGGYFWWFLGTGAIVLLGLGAFAIKKNKLKIEN